MDKKRTIKKILVRKGSYPPEADGSSNRRWAVAVPPSQLSKASTEAFLFMFTLIFHCLLRSIETKGPLRQVFLN